jgi:ubiquinone biosynthesis protein UbiJ
MATQSPFSFVGGVFERLAAGPQPPQWLVHEVQHRVVLLLNHVLMQEGAATQRLLPRRGRVVRVQWRQFLMALQITPAGLFDLAAENATPDLRLEVTQSSPLDLAQAVLRGERPNVRIDGDVQFASDIQWLADNLRWDLEEDMARLIGDVPAHALASAARGMSQALRSFVQNRAAPGGSASAWSVDRTIP